ncbi:DNA translocase FtsK [Alteromonas macleodii]|jgi:S-DNA-T family DNA segregation ATPase FtsK/SpoIIIE|uniref:DNA translocase FtsK n=1 Tax=Alteromonas TaxID=226 RepID=UPI000ECD769C|nr:DNA translocase FtsK [Alteromonas macleodii]CAI3958631.1 DNA translocase FtsK [Alteromonas macleodii]VTP55492.1 DNA translocase FtsK [Alteromonas macleodii]HAO16886.1 cell division protein FtsK [Alteromonas macleodii]HBN99619.1 cell division protein FtsK [Alteromonas macleodii]HCG87493.1 cell division protein FtsK [Alteromonas macleodii]|tara:strand:+ start:2186 stop:4975 length:2790 start_codon:yes stop_codon:yes gene_type:complete
MARLTGVQRVWEAGMIIACVFAFFLLLALASFHPGDPGWSQAGLQLDVHNWVGATGAWVADLLLFSFGFLAYLLPFGSAFLGWFLFQHIKELDEFDYLTIGLRIIGGLLMALGATGIASINFDDIYNFSAGGFVGDVISSALVPYFNTAGTILLLLCFFCTGFTLLTGISWLTIIDRLGEGTLWLGRKTLSAPQSLLAFEMPRLALANKSSNQSGDEGAELDITSMRAEPLASTAQTKPSQTQKTTPSRSEPTFGIDDVDDEPPFYTYDGDKSVQSNPNDTVNAEEDDATSSADVAETKKSSFSLSGMRSAVTGSFKDKVGLGKSSQDDSVQSEDDSSQHEHKHQAQQSPHINFDDLEEFDEDLPYETGSKPITSANNSAPSVEGSEPNTETLQSQTVETQGASQGANQAFTPAALGAKPVKARAGELDPDLPPMPSFDLLERADKHENPLTPEEIEGISRLVEEKLADFNIEATVVGVFPGPVITRFELDLAPGVKVSKISGLSKDLARAMSAISVRVVEVIPGKSVIGLELPNKKREMVRLSEVISCDTFQSNKSPLTMVLGADISGQPVVVDLAKMPHLLVAGTTGSGKSVGVNVMILSLLYKSTPEDVRMIMIDPKMLELSVYEGIPHLLAEVVTDMKEAANALRWCVGEMERRYRLMSALGVRNLKGYNAKVEEAIANGTPIKDPLWKNEESMDAEAPDLAKLPAIVVVVDEFADMMMIVGKKVEELIARIAQKARAAGIHLILATQRPSVDVITGLIKANIPTRCAFQVSSKIDSRTILDQQGAETLLGMGDMLYLPPGSPVPTRVHGAFVDDHEVHAVVADWQKRGEPEYIDEILNGEATAEVLLPGEQPEGEDQEFDAFYDEAVAFVTETRRASVSSVQRKFRIGYNRAARLVEQMEMSGVVSAQGHNGNREVLAPPPHKE